MPKVKTINAWHWPATLGLLAMLAAFGMFDAHAQAPTLQDVIEAAKQAKALELNKAANEAFKPNTGPALPPMSAMPPLPSPGGSVPPLPSAAAQPELRAIYGINQVLMAEVVVDGRSHALYSDEARTEIGPWTYGLVFPEGVLLLKKPLNEKQAGLLAQQVTPPLGRPVRCARLGLTPTHCLYLPAVKSGVTANAVPVLKERNLP